MDHPYKSLSSRAFWKAAVSNVSLFDIGGLWRPKLSIEPDSRIVTFGSCFAQHLGRALVANEFNWWSVEPGFKNASPELLAKYGYGVFSARTGNIYTTKALRQWVDWAFGMASPPSETWLGNGRYYDPFRPSVEPDGFESRKELDEARETTLTCLKKAFRETDVVVFTLGLTEAWEHASGHVYTGCPGVIAGEFSNEVHKFRNYTHAEILEDLRHVVDVVKAANPGVRFLLTVSPVPLTATASGDHVLVANTYSKSVLRAVAGQACIEDEAVDYFPSYEIITAHPYRGLFFDPNLRTVNQSGVAHVMNHFIGALTATKSAPRAKPTPQPQPRALSISDVQCDEEMLESFAGIREASP
jgi:hypothetical protein